MPIYIVDNQKYNLPDEAVQGFLQQFPNAQLVEDESVEKMEPVAETTAPAAGRITRSNVGDSQQVVGSSDLQEAEDEPNILQSLAARTARGFVDAAKGLSSAKDAMIVSAANIFDPDMTAEERQALYDRVEAGIPGLGALSTDNFEAASDWLTQYVRDDELENQSVTEALKDGDFAEAAELTVGGALESIPSVLAALTGYGGIALFGASVAGNKFDEELEKNPKATTLNLATNAVVSGATEAGFELVTRGILKKAGFINGQMGAKAAKEFLNQSAGNIAKKVGLGYLGEAGSEAATELTQTINDAYGLLGTGKLGGAIEGRADDTLVKTVSNNMNNIIDAGIIGGFMGGTISTVGQLGNQTAVRNRAEEILAPEVQKEEIKRATDNISRLTKDLENTTDEYQKGLLMGEIESETDNIIKTKKNISLGLSALEGDALSEYAENAAEIEIAKKSLEKETTSSGQDAAQKRVNDLVLENENILETALTEKFEKTLETSKKEATRLGIDFKEFETTKEVEEYLLSKDKRKTKKSKEIAQSNDGSIIQYEDGTQEIIINKEVAQNNKAVNVAAHELLHGVLFKTLKDNPGTAIDLGKALGSEIAKINIAEVADSNFARRLALYQSDPEAVQGEEVLALFADAVATGDIKYNDNVFTKFGDGIRKILEFAGVKKKFNTGRDVYNFIKDYNADIAKGGIRQSIIEGATEGFEGKLVKNKVSTKKAVQMKKSVTKALTIDQINEQVKTVEKGKMPQELAAQIAYAYEPLANSIAEKIYRTYPEFKEQGYTKGDFAMDIAFGDPKEIGGVNSIVEIAKEYDPKKDKSLGGWLKDIANQRAKRIADVRIGRQKTTGAQTLDAPAVDKAVDEITPEIKETKAIVKKLNIAAETVDKAKNAVDKAILNTINKLKGTESLTATKRLAIRNKAFNDILDGRLYKDIQKEFGRNTNTSKSFTDYLNKNFETLREAAIKNIDFQKGVGTSLNWNTKAPTKQEFIDYYLAEGEKKSTRSDRKRKLAKAVGIEIANQARAEYVKNNPIEAKQFKKQTGIILASKSQGQQQSEYSDRVNIVYDKFIRNAEGNKVQGGKANNEVKERIKKEIIPTLKEKLTDFEKASLIYALTGTGKDKDFFGVGRGAMIYPNVNAAREALSLSRDKYNEIKRTDKFKKANQYAGRSVLSTSRLSLKVIKQLETDKSLHKIIQEENAAKKDVLFSTIKKLAEIVKENPSLADGVNHLIGLQSSYQGHFIRKYIPFISFTKAGLLKDGAHDEHYSKSLRTTRFVQSIIDRAANDSNYTVKEIEGDLNDLWKGMGRGIVSKADGKRFDEKKDLGNQTYISESAMDEVLKNVESPADHLLLPGTEVNPSDNNIPLTALKGPKVKGSKSLSTDFNRILEEVKGVPTRERFSEARANILGKKKNPFKFFVPYSAEDYMGLIYPTLGKGKIGDKNLEWYKKNIIDPYARGIRDFESDKQLALKSWEELKAQIKNTPDKLNKEAINDFTNENAIRIHLWAKQGVDFNDIGLNKKEVAAINRYVKSKPELKEFTNLIQSLTPDGYPEPTGTDWLAGTITTDLVNYTNTVSRAKYLKEWQNNVDIVYSKDNMNKLKAIYGENYSDALQDMLYRMKTGRNRPSGGNKLTNQYLNWVNDSVGTIMFFNMRSAMLQTISSVNYLNWTDNNPINVAKTAANQKQFWSDFSEIFNSDFLKSRRSGLKTDVNADEIARTAETSKNKFRAGLSALLKKGFLPTQMADSFAISFGGASFYRNRIKTYLKQGLNEKAAKEKAFLDFKEITEESQQSSRPDRVSMQQASPLGRVILAFANTPMQYTRLTKKAALDLINQRGDWKTNLSKLMYYGAVQNIIFTALQSAMFAMLFSDTDDDKEKEKIGRIGNGIADTLLRGSGVAGAAVATAKNMVLEAIRQYESGRPNYEKVANQITTLSPPINSKLRKLQSAGRAFTYKQNLEKMREEGPLSIDNPAYMAAAEVLSATANIPLDRALRKLENLRASVDSDTEMWQRISLMLGYSKWDVGIIQEERKQKKIDNGLRRYFEKQSKIRSNKKRTNSRKTTRSKTTRSSLNKGLPNGVLGRANNDGTIEIKSGLPKAKEKKVIAHEKQHMRDMKAGKLNYDDNFVYWNSSKYKRTNDNKIVYNGKKFPEGHSKLPWEAVANKAERKVS
tara:strand:+ start:4339 stop:10833 length:6495 start_codon:yes stop_codon:yes gene_type:complete